MVKLYDGGAYLVNGTQIITDEAEVKAKTGREVSKGGSQNADNGLRNFRGS